MDTREVAADEAGPFKRISDFVELGKPRVVLMVLITTWVGFYLGSSGPQDFLLLFPTLIGTGLAAAGTLALNEYIERDIDALMHRTRSRPLPDGRVLPAEALWFGVVTTLTGLAYLALAVNWLSCAVTASITVTYLFLYTPMKRTSPFCTLVGSVPGALPPVTGWAAARGDLSVEPWVLFAIMFLWQLPHSLAIARLYRDDYARGGILLLPVVEPDSHTTALQVVINTFALLVVAMLPTLIGMAGRIYFVTAFLFGLLFLYYAVLFARHRTAPAARRLLFASLIYLPALFVVLALDKSPVLVLISH